MYGNKQLSFNKHFFRNLVKITFALGYDCLIEIQCQRSFFKNVVEDIIPKYHSYNFMLFPLYNVMLHTLVSD